MTRPTHATPSGRRRITVLLAAPAVAVLALAGCGSSSHQAATTTTASTTATSAASDASSTIVSSTNSAAFLTAMHTQHDFDGLSDANVTKLGEDVCGDFQGGADLNAVESDAVKAMNEINANDAKSGNNGSGALNQHDAGFLIGAGVKALCPQYSDQLNG